MFPQSMSRSELRPDRSSHDLAHTLEEHLLAGFPPDLALDLVLNELVARAAEATRAGGAALALTRGDEMVCRAATGQLSPGLGLTLNARDGLSGACLQTRQPQLSPDTELDSRVDRTASRRLGIRSILIVPVFVPVLGKKDDDLRDANERREHDRHEQERHEQERGGQHRQDSQLMGILEVFSAAPGAFSQSDQKLLEGFAEDCARIRVVASELSWHKPAANSISDDFMPPPLHRNELVPGDIVAAESPAFASGAAGPEDEYERVNEVASTKAGTSIAPIRTLAAAPPGSMSGVPLPARSRYEVWSLVVGGLAIVAIVAVSFLFGSRLGWLRQATSHPTVAQTATAPASEKMPAETSTGTLHQDLSKEKSSARAQEKVKPKSSTPVTSPVSAPVTGDELVVYEKGKVVFRMKPAPSKADAAGPERANRQAAVAAPLDSRFESKKTNGAGQDGKAVIAASSIKKIDSARSIWLSPQEAERRLLSRTEPQFPREALAAHRAGNVVLEVQVGEDGTVSNVRTLSGDPILANAATEAVRNWRYQPYREHNQPSQFQTDVTLSFALPE